VNLSHHEAAMEQSLEAATRKQDEAELCVVRRKQKPAPVKAAPNPFAFLGRLTISGVFGDKNASMVMLNGEGSVFVARGGKLYDANEEEVPGVRSQIRDNSLALIANGRLYSIELPK
jgi:hypothetical protein